MKKPSSLRRHLEEAVPHLRANPDRLTVFVEGGRLVAAGAPSLSFRYEYTLTLTVLDHQGDLDVLAVPVLAWLRIHQPEIALNHDLRDKALRFHAELLNHDTADLEIQIDLSETVVVQERVVDGQRRLDVRHIPEPVHAEPYATGDYALYLGDGIGAEWHMPADVDGTP
jgi:hypothetical protein